MPILSRTRILGAKHQTTPGTAESLSNSDASFLARNVEINPDISYEDSDGTAMAALSHITGDFGPYGGVIRFEHPVFGGSEMPAWASTFLPACGMKLSDDVWVPESLPPEAAGSGAKLLTIGVWQGGILKKLRDAMGNLELICRAGFPIMARFTFFGVWQTVTNDSMPSVTHPTTKAPRFASSGITIGSFNPKLNELSLNWNNQVELREDSRSPEGYYGAVIVGRRPAGRMDPEATITGSHGSDVYTPYADMVSQTSRALSFAIGSQGNRVAVSAPAIQITNVQEGRRRDLQTDDVEFQCNRSTSAGDDELTLKLD